MIADVAPIAPAPQVKPHLPRRRPLLRWLVLAVATALIATGVWMRARNLGGTPGLNSDEAWSGLQVIAFMRDGSNVWRTPTGNPLNVFFWGPLVVLHSVLPPSTGLLRSVSLASGLLALAANFLLCRPRYGPTTAIISTVLLACLPALIAYSRFAWDTSQTPLVSVLVVYASLAAAVRPRVRWYHWLGLVACLLLAVWIHPTNIFLAPQTFVCAARWPAWLARPRLPVAVVLSGVVLAFAGLLYVRSAEELLIFAFDLGRLFSGTATYQFISGGASIDELHWFDAITWAFMAWGVLGFYQRLKAEDHSGDRRLAWGFALALAGFCLVAGVRGVHAHYERYALWCLVPGVLIVARGVAWWWYTLPDARLAVATAVLLVTGSWLMSFQSRYFAVFERSGGESHLAFRLSEQDPKLEALQTITTLCRADERALIVSRNWWTRLPLEYLAAGHSRLRVARQAPANASALYDHVFFVELAGSPDELQARERLASSGTAWRQWQITDRAGRPVVLIFQILPQVRSREAARTHEADRHELTLNNPSRL